MADQHIRRVNIPATELGSQLFDDRCGVARTIGGIAADIARSRLGNRSRAMRGYPRLDVFPDGEGISEARLEDDRPRSTTFDV